MRKDKRESICFEKEYSLLRSAINDKSSITCTFQDENYSLIPYKTDLNYVDGSLYLIAVEIDNPNICHTFRLCWLRDIVIKDNYKFEFGNKAVEKLEYIIYEYDYTNKITINLNRLKIKK